ncbi:MAG: hypothetical protein KAQ98_11260 [Bacteriovoracaceae bacterium]|nr:hypothetical protein [Bacteriovoracaceae bacterium]
MFVRKFEADSLDEALQSIKHELGPDAIILKTVTNKGLKGAFKKKKIEITAAVTEKNLKNKMNVDSALGEKRDDFYQNRPSFISNMISGYASNSQEPQERTDNISSRAGYGGIGLNRQVKTVKKHEKITNANSMPPMANDLDNFLQQGMKNVPEFEKEEVVQERLQPSQPFVLPEESIQQVSLNNEEVENQKRRIDELELKLFEMVKNVEKLEKKEPTGIFQLRTSLKSLDIKEPFVQKTIRKAMLELSEDDLDNDEMVFEFALREMLNTVKVEMPLFSSVDSDNDPVVTVLVSEIASGQSSMALKLGTLKENAVVIKNIEGIDEDKTSFTEKIFNLNIIRVGSIAEIILKTRKALEEGRSVFIDYKNFNFEINETKKFVEGLRRSFDKVEVLVSLSAIHSELYNNKVLLNYKNLADGVVISHLDICLDHGSLFNILESETSLPAKFFGTGKMVPDDMESATSERILNGIFKFD